MKRLSLAAVALMLLAPAGCANRYQMDANAPTYAAQAKIRVKVNKTGTRDVHLRLDHLAPPAKVEGGYRGYAVWFRVPGHGVTKAGTVDYDFKRRKGKLFATTPHAKFEVVVTLERDLSVQAPSANVIIQRVVGAT